MTEHHVHRSSIRRSIYQEEELKKIFKRTEQGWPRPCSINKFQSPVELTTRFAYQMPFPAVNLKNFHKFENLQISNSTDTVRITFPNLCYCKRPKLTGAGLNQEYTLENIHFHWPSEHVIDQIRYDLEAHFVCFDDRFGNYENAIRHPNGITILAILFLKTNFTRTNNFKKLAESVKSISNKTDRSTVCNEAIDLYHFLPYDHATFFRYEGSITTPDCMDHVNWIVLKNNSNISFWDFKNLTKIYNKTGLLIGSNNRQLQELNNRRISMRADDQ